MYLKPQYEPSFSVYPDKADINQFFSTIKQGQNEEGERLRTELAQKYHALAANRPELKIDLFGGGKDNDADLSKIQRVVIYRTKDERILCAPVIDGISTSVTLAQGILESSNGQSQLARNENNHFGIKATQS